MDLIFSYKSRYRLWIWILLVVCLFCSLADSWRISQKCPHGHYYNDGCTACWCDASTGQTKCEKLSKCPRGHIINHVKCPNGRRYKDTCGNDCTCYEASGAVLCNEKMKCPQDVHLKLQGSQMVPADKHKNVFLRRDGIAAHFIPPKEEHNPIKLRFRSTTPLPPIRPPSTPTTTTTTSRSRYNGFYENIQIDSTPHPRVRIPTGEGRSEELIIEPAIIIRKKGSNKASIVRNPSSATSVTLPSRRNHQDHDIILRKTDDGNFQYSSSSSSSSSSRSSSSLAPIHLYEKQLQAIMNIKRAYSALLRSKVNFNLQIGAGKEPQAAISITTDHPRRFDSNYENSTVLMNSTPTPTPPPIYITSQQPRPTEDGQGQVQVQVKPFQPLVWRKEIKNVLKQFSPVPPLKQLVSYVSTSTENYLRDFLNKNRLKQPLFVLPTLESTTPTHPPPPPFPPEYYTNPPQQTPAPTSHQEYYANPPQTPPPTPPPPLEPYPLHPFSTVAPFQESYFDPNTMPVHDVYQNHDFKMITPSPQPSLVSSYPGHNSYLHKTLGSQEPKPFHPFEHSKGEQFPFMNELMQQIARLDNVDPNTTPRSSPGLTALPTFSTPGPPYAEIQEVQPLSILPQPQPEPPTPTRRTFVQGHEHQHPTVRVNLDKPIYINPPSQPQVPQHSPPQQRYPPPPQQPQHPPPQQRYPQPQPPQQSQRPNLLQQWFSPPPQQQPHPTHPPRFHPPPQHPATTQHRFHPPHPYPSVMPHLLQNNRRIHTMPHTPHRPQYFAPPTQHQQQQQSNYQSHSQPHLNPQQLNNNYRPLFPQFFMPSRPKQYRLVLKGNVRDAAVRVDDVVPRFVSKIAHEFFKKPEIYIPKIRPGKPLTLEKVILNHKEIVPTAMSFSPTPGVAPTKMRFTPQAQWEMREELARQGIMLNEPLNAPIRDYVANDPTVMEMDAPLKAMNTWETHSEMGMGTFNDFAVGGGGGGVTPAANIHQIIQQSESHQQNQQLYNPILFSTASPPQVTAPSPSLDHQHQQELQHQLLLAAQQNQYQQSLGSSSISQQNNNFKIDFGDFNDFKQDGHQQGGGGQHVFPPELQLPGVEQVVVDKYLVHDPMNPSGGMQMYSTTTVQPPTTLSQNPDISSILTLHHRNGLAALPAHGPTLPPSVLVRHHGAPTPSTTPQPLMPMPTEGTPLFASTYGNDNILVTVINSTPTPQPFVTTTITSVDNPPYSPSLQSDDGMGHSDGSGIVSQINDFLTEQMDFGARPQLNLYDLLFHRRTGEAAATQEDVTENYKNIQFNEDINHENKEATEMARDDHHHINDQSPEENDDQIAIETRSSHEDTADVDTEKLANIFSIDYKNKYNKKPPSVIVIKVPPGHSDGPFPKVVEKRRGEEIEIVGGSSSSTKKNKTKDADEDESTEKSNVSTQKTSMSSESDDDEDSTSRSKESSSSSSKQRRKNRKRKRRRRKKKNRNKNKSERIIEEDYELIGDADSYNDKPKDVDRNEKRGQMKQDEDEDKANSKEKRKKEDIKIETETTTTPTSKISEVNIGAEAEEKFQQEIDWKSQLMANICDLNPSSPLCLTYRSICLLMTSDNDE